MILETLTVGAFAVNCYVVGDESTRQGMIVDPGDEPERIMALVRKLDLTITLIVNTHCHADHVGGLAAVKRATQAQFAIHQAEVPVLEHAPASAVMLIGQRMEPLPQPEILLKDGDELTVGNLTFKVMHTPGHTPGGICLLHDDVCLTGDTLFNMGIGRFDFPGGNYNALMKSITQRLLTLPDNTGIYPGHGPHSTIGTEKNYNPFFSDYQDQ
ncbi:MAG: MBL fold metallo-hydrolase [Chloroflexota bacterium]|nr:MAG: MBL fold metallo-hydrolase [Chloroflexota bacterium]